jgi:hypothetical protein
MSSLRVLACSNAVRHETGTVQVSLASNTELTYTTELMAPIIKA